MYARIQIPNTNLLFILCIYYTPLAKLQIPVKGTIHVGMRIKLHLKNCFKTTVQTGVTSTFLKIFL